MLSAMIERLNGEQGLELKVLAFGDELHENGRTLLEELGVDLAVDETRRTHGYDERAYERLGLAVDLAELGLDLVEYALVLLLLVGEHLVEATLVRLGRYRRRLCALAATARLTPLQVLRSNEFGLCLARLERFQELIEPFVVVIFC